MLDDWTSQREEHRTEWRSQLRDLESPGGDPSRSLFGCFGRSWPQFPDFAAIFVGAAPGAFFHKVGGMGANCVASTSIGCFFCIKRCSAEKVRNSFTFVPPRPSYTVQPDKDCWVGIGYQFRGCSQGCAMLGHLGCAYSEWLLGQLGWLSAAHYRREAELASVYSIRGNEWQRRRIGRPPPPKMGGPDGCGFGQDLPHHSRAGGCRTCECHLNHKHGRLRDPCCHASVGVPTTSLVSLHVVSNGPCSRALSTSTRLPPTALSPSRS